MKLFFAAVLLFVSLGISGRSVIYGQPAKHITVKIHREVVHRGGLRVRFISIVEDSRCPTDTNCIWAGNAKIRMRVTKSGRAKDIEMHTNGPNNTVAVNGYSLTLMKLTPEPRSNIRINPNGYVATIKISRSRG